MSTGHRLAWLLATALVLPTVAACSGDGGGPPTIGILRAIPGTEREAGLLEGLAASGYARKDLRILGAAPTEIHPDAADVRRTVDRWEARDVDVIVALSTPVAAAAVKATDLPVVTLTNDPVAGGLLRNERHPEGHVTGATFRVPSDRLLSVAADAFGELHRVGCIVVPDDPGSQAVWSELRRGAKTLGAELDCAEVHGPDDVGPAMRRLVASGVDLIDIVGSAQMATMYPTVAEVTGTIDVPVVSTSPLDFAVLLLEPDGRSVYRTVGRQVARLLHGAKVRDVPVEDPGRFLLVVNERQAIRIGHPLPAAVLRRADQVVR